MASVTFSHKCSNCEMEVVWHAGQGSHGKDLECWMACHCQHCGHQVESDDLGFPADWIRLKLLEQEGLWAIREGEPVIQRYAFFLARRFQVPTSKLMRLIKSRLNKHHFSLLVCGTRVEMAWMLEQMKVEKLDGEVVRIEITTGEVADVKDLLEGHYPAWDFTSAQGLG